jgi:hypothetical protein
METLLISRLVKAEPVNCDAWSVLNVCGLPYLPSASCNVSAQNAASIVIDSRQDSTRQLSQSRTTAR